MFAEVRVELADGFAEAVEDAMITARGHDVHVAELLRVGRVVSTPRHHPQATSNTTVNTSRYLCSR